MSNIEDRVKSIIANQVKKDPSDIKNSDDFANLGADSLDTVELVMAFEDEFEVSIPDEDASKMKTVQDVLDYIAKHNK